MKMCKEVYFSRITKLEALVVVEALPGVHEDVVTEECLNKHEPAYCKLSVIYRVGKGYPDIWIFRLYF